MKYILSLSFLFTQMFSQEIDNSFITQYEYGAMLYNNPRGIGCVKCHKSGITDVVIAKYIDKKGELISLKAPSIYQINFEDFQKKLNAQRNMSSVMPTYFLTSDEVKSLYFYVKQQKK